MRVLCGALLCSVVASAVFAANGPYQIPEPKIEVFKPRGLRVSIPDSPGITEMHFRAVVNQESNHVYLADMSQEILQQTDGRWVFADNRIKLKRGDVLRYWLFVSRNNLGFNLDDQRYTVHSIQAAPPGFLEKDWKPTPEAPNTPIVDYESATLQPDPTVGPTECPCQNEAEEPELIVTVPPAPLCPQASTTTAPPPTTGTTPKATASPAELQIWKDILVTLSTENAEFRDKIQVLMDLNSLMLSKLEKIGDANLKKVVIGGKISVADAPFPLAQMVLKEKLGIMKKILVSAVRNSDGTVTIELDTFDHKLDVLLKAQQKLKDSRITISDIGDVGPSGNDADKIIFDVRQVEK